MYHIHFTDQGVEFRDYPFPPASVYPRGIVPYTEIANLDPASNPPEIRLNSGEILFLSAFYKDDLLQISERQGLAITEREDNWSLLLEPFLDTELDAEWQKSTIQSLTSRGFSLEEINEIRHKVDSKMTRYNFIHMEWHNLGLYDLLDAYMGQQCFIIRHLKSRRNLYWYAMDISNRGNKID
ncbi:MAG: hypothetical protein OEZ36_13495 [Spirochaetota bacterium]|nr:hypothetical protein [Spirochaetota bacterium]